jgi:hypothetical protein
LSATHLRRHREDSAGSGAISPQSTSPEPLEPPIAIPVGKLHPHPGNPRLKPRQDVIDQICSCLSDGGFDPAHALIVRPFSSDYQILSGHHRHAAAVAAGLEAVPCWVRDLGDEAAYMLLVISNAQGELMALERGMHALNSKMTERAYAAKAGRPLSNIDREIRAARVASVCLDIETNLADWFSQFCEIHAAPRWLWPALAAVMAAEKWTVARTREQVERLKGLSDDMPGWAGEKFVEGLVSGVVPVRDVARCEGYFERTIEESIRIHEEIAELQGLDPPSKDDVSLEFWEGICFIRGLSKGIPFPTPDYFESYADVMDACALYLDRERTTLNQHKADKRDKQRKQQDAAARSARLLEFVMLQEWKYLDDATRKELLPPDPGRVTEAKFNPQESGAIEWAKWSWNPITGCEHDCPYCYARDIANDARKASAFPNGFAPTLRPRSLLAPRNHPEVPLEAQADARLRNVFTGSGRERPSTCKPGFAPPRMRLPRSRAKCGG